MKKIIIRIGGSVIASPPNPKLLEKYAELIKDLRKQGHQIAVVVGGGKPAREFINLARELGLSEREQDELAISVSRIFAQALAMKIGGYEWRRTPTTTKEAAEILDERGIVVMGGVKPGMTTDAVAALLASEAKADLIVKATDQSGVYTKDPRSHPDAKKLDEISFDELEKLLAENRHHAGIHQIIDPEAVRILKEKHITTIVVNGFKPENILLAIRGAKIGTIIH
ncbi:MAG TPA: UMP kinase [Candidatus Bathyarchaeota archaeon]|nr:UMP kinase [Candidatus Bathyarchaeota archaeon]